MQDPETEDQILIPDSTDLHFTGTHSPRPRANHHGSVSQPAVVYTHWTQKFLQWTVLAGLPSTGDWHSVTFIQDPSCRPLHSPLWSCLCAWERNTEAMGMCPRLLTLRQADPACSDHCLPQIHPFSNTANCCLPEIYKNIWKKENCASDVNRMPHRSLL